MAEEVKYKMDNDNDMNGLTEDQILAQGEFKVVGKLLRLKNDDGIYLLLDADKGIGMPLRTD